MRARFLVPVLPPLLWLSAVACSTPPSEDDRVGSTTQALRPVGSDPPPPKTVEPPPPAEPCLSLRYDLYRNSGQSCAVPPAAAGGTWSVQPLFPNAPISVRDRFCAYTWTPTGKTPQCAVAPVGAISRTPAEQLGARGHCPLNQSGCGTTIVNMAGPTGPLNTTPPNVLLAMAKTTGGSSHLAMAAPAVAVAQGQTAPTATSSSSGGSTGPGNGAIPIGGVGCCDACAEITDAYTFVVLPENTSYGSVYFDISYESPGEPGGFAIERITIPAPATNVMQVNLNPARRYPIGMIWAIHTTS